MTLREVGGVRLGIDRRVFTVNLLQYPPYLQGSCSKAQFQFHSSRKRHGTKNPYDSITIRNTSKPAVSS